MGDLRLATIETTSTTPVLYLNFSDHLNSSSITTDANGNITNLMDYLPFGSDRINIQQGTFIQNYKFTGKEFDTESNLYDFGARQYNPQIGRFVSQDPLALKIALADEVKKEYKKDQQELLKNPQMLNTYSYVKNNPFSRVDPTGEIDVHTNGATEEQIQTFNDALKQLTIDVKNNQQIQDYFKLFKNVDIVDVLSNEKSGPDVYLGGVYNWLSNLKGNNGTYFGLTNDIGFGDSGLKSSDSVKNTLIHELAHWANDYAKTRGDLNPDVGSFKTDAKSEKFDYLGDNIGVEDYVRYDFLFSGKFETIRKDSIYGYAAQLILYGKY